MERERGGSRCRTSCAARAARVARAVAIVAALCGLAARAPAQASQPQSRTRDHLTVSVVSPWPQDCDRGYAPVWIELSNDGADPLQLELALDLGGSGRDVRWSRGVTLAGGDPMKIEVAVPLLGASLGGATLSVDVAGEPGRIRIPMAAASGDAGEFRLVVVTDERHAELANSLGAPFSDTLAALVKLYPPTSRSGSPKRLPLVAAWTFGERLPTRFESWTSVDGALVDWDRAPLGGEPLEALLAWVRLGGRVALVSESGPELVQEIGALAAWNEPRFRLEESSSAALALQVGAGVVVVASAIDPAAFARRFSGDADAIPLHSDNERRRWPSEAELGDIGAVSARGGAFALLLFVVLIGPVNFFVVARRWRKPVLLIVSTPLLALATALAFLGYGLFRQGLDIKLASVAVTLLDQRSHRAATIERRELFAGFVGGGGLQPGAGSCVSPAPAFFDESAPWRRRDQDPDSFAVEEGAGGRLLRGGFLPARSETRQLVLCEAAARERLELRREGDRLVAVNAFGTRIDQLVVRAPDGRFLRAAAIPAGGAAPLEPADDAATRTAPYSVIWQRTRNLVVDDLVLIPPASYVAQLDLSPFVDPTGLELTLQRGHHLVLGILDGGEEAWR